MILRNYFYGQITDLPDLDPYGYQKLICIIKSFSQYYIVFFDSVTASLYIEEIIDYSIPIDRVNNTRAVSTDEEFNYVLNSFKASGLYTEVLAALNAK